MTHPNSTLVNAKLSLDLKYLTSKPELSGILCYLLLNCAFATSSNSLTSERSKSCDLPLDLGQITNELKHTHI
jgi:hypothetical protein